MQRQKKCFVLQFIGEHPQIKPEKSYVTWAHDSLSWVDVHWARQFNTTDDAMEFFNDKVIERSWLYVSSSKRDRLQFLRMFVLVPIMVTCEVQPGILIIPKYRKIT